MINIFTLYSNCSCFVMVYKSNLMWSKILLGKKTILLVKKPILLVKKTILLVKKKFY